MISSRGEIVHMFALSTSWNSKRHTEAGPLIREIRDAGFDTVELGFMLTERVVRGILEMRHKRLIDVVSLHNMCPLPPEISPEKASPDYYALSSPDEGERGRAVQIAKRTIQTASDFGAQAVILHAGRVELEDRTRELASSIDDTRRSEVIRAEMIARRNDVSRPFFERTLRSLGELIPFARSLGVALAVENRFYYREIPSLSELREIFRLFPKGEISYWHDVGHAEVAQRLGLEAHNEFLEASTGRLLGVHLHDIISTIQDHKAPLEGTFDFRRLKPYIDADVIKVIEAHQPSTAVQLRRAREYLEGIFAGGER